MLKVEKKSKAGFRLPGFSLTFNFTVFYLSLLVLIPLSMLFLKTFSMSWDDFVRTILSPRALAAFRLSFGASFISAILSAFFGFWIAWVFVRYTFPGKKFFDALVDLPFALPTAVTGICLATLYAPNGWLGKIFYHFGIKSAFNVFGIVIALTFIGFPFVVRTLQPVLEEMESEVEEAATSLGANRFQIFFHVLFPEMLPALLTGGTMAFARGVGEYGSVVFISGNMPMKTEIAPLLIMTKLEQYDYAGATAIAVVMLIISFGLLFVMNLLQAHSRRHEKV